MPRAVHWSLRWVLLLAICGPAGRVVAQDAPPRRIVGKTAAFSLSIPPDWQSDAYDRAADRPNARLLFRGGFGEGAATATDNFNLWWYGGPASALLGMASVHRLQVEGSVDLPDLVSRLNRAALPAGAQVRPAQLGSYPGLLGWATVEEAFGVAVVVIPQGHVAYVATLVGPSLVVAARWPQLQWVMASLQAPDLQPQRLEDVLGPLLPPAPEPDTETVTEPEPEAEGETGG